MPQPLREFVQELTEGGGNASRDEWGQREGPRARIERAIGGAGLVASSVSCLGPFLAADLFVLAPLHLKLTLDLAQIKDLEINEEQAGAIAREVLGVAWADLTSQALSGRVGKVVPVTRPTLSYSQNRAVAWAIGQGIAHLLDCMREEREPAPGELKQVFSTHLRAGRRRAEALSPEGINEQALVLRAKIGLRDASLRTKVRLRSKSRYVPSRQVANPTPQPQPQSGERTKIVIAFPAKPKPVEALPEPPTEEPLTEEAPTEEPLTEEAPTEPTTQEGKEFPEDAPSLAEGVSAEVPAGEETRGSRDEAASCTPGTPGSRVEGEPRRGCEVEPLDPSHEDASEEALGAVVEATPEARARGRSGSWVRGLERLARLHERGSLSDEEFRSAKGRLLD